MKVNELSVGIGPKIYSYKTKNTLYCLRCIPLGGYVIIDGLDANKDTKDGFKSRKTYQKFIVLVSGVVMNFVLAFCLIFSLTMTGSKVIDKNSNKVVEIVLANKEKTEAIGNIPGYEIRGFEFVEATEFSFSMLKGLTGKVFEGMKDLTEKENPAESVSGPIEIIKVIGETTTSENKADLIWLIVFISINVGVFNMIPFPALDGGRVVFVILEALGLKINSKIEERINAVGAIAILCLVAFTMYKDIF